MSSSDTSDVSASAPVGGTTPDQALMGKFASLLTDIASSATPAIQALSAASPAPIDESSRVLGKSNSSPTPSPAVSFSPSASRTLAFGGVGLTGVGLTDVDDTKVPFIRSSVIGRYIIYFNPKESNSPRCLAPVGKKGIKWCFSDNCKIAAHKDVKPISLREGLYIKEKSASELALCIPCIPDAYTHMGEVLIKQWLDAFDPKTVAEWEMEFAVVNDRIKDSATGKSRTKEEWEAERKHQASAADGFKTPGKGTFAIAGTAAKSSVQKLSEAVDLMESAIEIAMAKVL